MTIQIDESKLNGLNAIVAKANAVEDAAQTTAQEYLEARVGEMLSSYDSQLIEQAKIRYDDMVTLAASLSPEKQEQLVAMVHELAAQ